MTLEVWLAWCLACIVISVTPGAGAINAMSNGLQYGIRHSLPAVLGQQLGLAAQFVIVGIGVGSLLASSEHLFEVVRWSGVLYLLWLGIQKWRQPFIPLTISKSCDLQNLRRFWQSTLVNLSNPKATIFLIALLPQFIDPDRSQLAQLLPMIVTSLLIDSVVMLGYAGLATSLARWIKSERRQKILNQLFGGLFIFAAALMAVFQRN